MRLSILVSFAGALFLSGCQPAGFDPNDPAAIAAIESIVQDMMAGARSVNAEQVLAAAAPDATLITGDVMLSGLATLQGRFRNTYSSLSRQTQSVIQTQTRLLSTDVALVTIIAEGSYTDEAGWTSEPVGIGTTLVFVREAGKWSVHHVHQSIAQ